MMTAKQASNYLGRTGHLTIKASDGAIQVKVTVLDAREVWGRLDLFVRGDGTSAAWVQASRVTLEADHA